MSLIRKWLAKNTPFADAAKAMGESYVRFRRRCPDPYKCPDRMVFDAIIEERYEGSNDPIRKNVLFDQVKRDEGLLELVVKALTIEGNFAQQRPEVQAAYRKAIEEKLLEAGVPGHVVYKCDVAGLELDARVTRDEVKDFVSSGSAQGDKWHHFLMAIHPKDEIWSYTKRSSGYSISGWAIVRQGRIVYTVERTRMRFF